ARAGLMRRLYLQIYLTIIAILVIMMIAVGATWRIAATSRFDHAIEAASDFVETDLPPAAAPRAAMQRALERLGQRLRAPPGPPARGGARRGGAGPGRAGGGGGGARPWAGCGARADRRGCGISPRGAPSSPACRGRRCAPVSG